MMDATTQNPCSPAPLPAKKTPEMLAITSAEKMAEQLRAEIRPFSRVTAIDTDKRAVALGAETMGYRQLVLALGADPIHIPVQGDARDRVMSVNDLLDYTRFRRSIEHARHVTLLGAGLIGCEFANGLSNAGIRVDVIDPALYPLNRFLPEAAGRALQAALSSLGVQWHLGLVATSIDRAGDALTVTLSDNSQFQTDAVLSAVGLRPRIQLATEASLQTNKGIVVNRYLAASAPDLYALGDCAEVEGMVLPFVMPIMQAARALGKTLAAMPTPVEYPAMPVVVKTPCYPVVVSPPRIGIDGNWAIQPLDKGIRALYYGPDRKLEGFALPGEAVAEKNSWTKDLSPLLA
jgi:rubredoxin-NAD+ reductase